ncbi:hypothetical protein D3C81_2086380 [compost metagenome]
MHAAVEAPHEKPVHILHTVRHDHHIPGKAGLIFTVLADRRSHIKFGYFHFLPVCRYLHHIGVNILHIREVVSDMALNADAVKVHLIGHHRIENDLKGG